VSESKEPAVPVWYKNTYFWISALLLIIGGIGLVAGDNAIRDPGQKVEHHLWFLYLLASIVMLLGGIISHRQTVQQYQEDQALKK
jgi:hypothetical protein